MVHARVAVRDFDHADQALMLPEAVRALATLLALGHSVYVHCTAGINRATLTVVGYYTFVKGWGLDDALAHVRTARPQAHPYVDCWRTVRARLLEGRGEEVAAIARELYTARQAAGGGRGANDAAGDGEKAEASVIQRTVERQVGCTLSLVEGARGATSLLRRVALSAAGVWFFPPLVLHSFAAAAGVAWGALAGGLYAATKGGVADLPREAVVLGAASGFTAWLVLAFFSGVLLSVVDAVFYCYALDRDTGATTRSDVHEVLDRVPCGVVVQNPGGGLAYGARRVAPGSLAGGGAV